LAEHWDERAVFLAALDLDPSDRDAFLRGACPNDDARLRIEQLLRHHTPTPGVSSIPESIREFRIIERLGEGGMGVVYLAEDTVLGRRVALKMLSDRFASDERALARFYHEARAAAQLVSPLIVQVYQFGQEHGVHFIALEYVEGQTLSEWLQEAGSRLGDAQSTAPVSTRITSTPVFSHPQTSREHFRRVAQIVAEIAAALDVAHTHDPPVIHRDVKPSNILIDHHGAAKITDFGIAKIVSDPSLTSDGLSPATPQYMSPEQAEARETRIDHRTDIFSLGVVLYELLSFRRPFEGDTIQEIVASLRDREASPLRSVNRAVPIDLATICHKAIEKRPSDRYQTAAHMAADLRCFEAGQPILARPPDLWRRLVRRAHRHRRLILATVLCALVVGVAALALERQARSRAESGRVSMSVVGTEPVATVIARKWSAAARSFGPALALGATPLRDASLPAGTYRFVLTDKSGRFHDFVDTVTPGSQLNRMVRLFATTDVPQDMVRFAGGKMPAQYYEPIAPGTTSDNQALLLTTPELAPFWIDRTEVSNVQYREYVEQTGATPPPYWPAMDGNRAPADPDYPQLDWPMIADLPVVGISRDGMQAYAVWIGKRLPTFEEWQGAVHASLSDESIVPWEMDPLREEAAPSSDAMARSQHTDLRAIVLDYVAMCRPVHGEDRLQSPAGLNFVFGNVREMTSTVVNGDSGPMAVLAGGGWWSDPHNTPVRHPALYPVSAAATQIGFRCARSVSPPPTPHH